MPKTQPRRARSEESANSQKADPKEAARQLRLTAERLGYRYAEDLSEYPIDPGAWELVPSALIRRHHVVPLGFDDKILIVAVADPANVIALDDLRTSTGRRLEIIVARQEEIDALITRFDRLDRSAEHLLEQAAVHEEEDEEDEEELDAQDAPIVKAINRIISRAVQQGASDIHIEPQQKDVRIRFRIDGVLIETMRTKRSLHSGMVSRLKVMSDLDIAEKRIPQDGRVTVTVDNRSVDLRVATLPTSWGEKVVLRILDNSSGVRALEDIGFDQDIMNSYESSILRPHGAVLITGPTGSGKSTTLYATLERINSSTKNIITVEDPVEARIAGVNQVQVNPRAGLSFAGALRSILRSDPDIVMVGEMRDHETATIGVEAALTGHLVFSTLHTNDAASAMTRLVEMGVEPFLVASALECVVAQRLARRLCPKCKEPYEPTPDMLELNGLPSAGGKAIPILYRPAGCSSCSGNGYKGRIAIVEVLKVSDEIRRLTVERYPAEDIKKYAIAEGMRTLREDGMRKALAGITSIEEVLRVVV